MIYLFIDMHIENQINVRDQNNLQGGQNSINQNVHSENIIQSHRESERIKSKWKPSWIFLILGVLITTIIAGLLGRLILSTSQKGRVPTTSVNIENQKPNTEIESNPKVEILVALPAEDPHILYNVLFDPYSHSAVYSIDKDQYTATSSSNVIIDGKEGKKYDSTTNLVTSPDGKRIAYIAKQDDKEFVVLDGFEGKKYDYIKNLKFSPDSKHIAYTVGEGKHTVADSKFSAHDETTTSFIIVDTNEGKKYDGAYVEANVSETYDPLFNYDGNMITYTAIKNGKNIVVVNEQEFSLYPNQQYPKFIGNTNDIVYLANDDKNYFLISAGQKLQSHDYISDAVGGSPVIYVGKDATQIAYEAVDNNIHSVVLTSGSSYPVQMGGLQDLTFSSSGKHVAYLTGVYQSKELFINGKAIGNVQPNKNIIVGSPIISPDEKLLAYSETDKINKSSLIRIVTLDGSKGTDFPLKGYKVIGPLKFSADGDSLYFKGWQDRKIVFLTLNIKKLL